MKIKKELAEKMYKEMLYYRRFEEQVNRAYTQGKFSGFCHLHVGQEAVLVGIQNNLIPSDYVISGYRSHTQAIAKGISPESIFAELYGRADGCSKGKGGSMHMFSKEHRFLGGHGIVGGQVPLATGAAFKLKYKKEEGISVCYLGDAASNQGQFFEAMNIAATWELPVLFVIENNHYGMGTHIGRSTSVKSLSQRALAFDMDHSSVDGMNVAEVHEHTKKIIKNMRKKGTPYLLEANTYRYKGHSVSDPATYRTKEEVEKYKSLDPLLQMEADLIKNKIADKEKLKSWNKEIKEEIKKVEAVAEKSPIPSDEEAFTDVYR